MGSSNENVGIKRTTRISLLVGVSLAIVLLGKAYSQVSFSVTSRLVRIPVVVTNELNQSVFELSADQFHVTDNGIPQNVSLVPDTDTIPLRTILLIETGSSSGDQASYIKSIDSIASSLLLGPEDKIAVMTFDSAPHRLLGFTSNASQLSQALSSLVLGGKSGAAMIDAVRSASIELEEQPPTTEHVIIMVSETRDHGSNLALSPVLRDISAAACSVYSIAYSPGLADAKRDLLDNPSDGNLDLLRPTMLVINALKHNTASALAIQSGGSYYFYGTTKGFERGLTSAIKLIRDRYIITYTPTGVSGAGLHVVRVTAPDLPGLHVHARKVYWAVGP